MTKYSNEKIPFLIVVGEKEVQEKAANLEQGGEETVQKGPSVQEIRRRRLRRRRRGGGRDACGRGRFTDCRVETRSCCANEICGRRRRKFAGGSDSGFERASSSCRNPRA